MKCIVAQKQAEFFQIMRIRAEVFMREQHVDSQIELDTQDDTAVHVLCLKENVPVGCLRILLQGEEATVGRVAVLKKERRHHIGKFMMNYVEQLAQQYGYKKITVHAQLTAKDFYLHCGFKEYGNLYEEANILHISMEKTLN